MNNNQQKKENDMRKLFFLLLLAAVTTLGSHALSVANTAGQLSQLVTNTQITELTVTGTMDARDFQFITNELTELTTIDLSQVTIVAVEGEKVLYGTISSFEANAVPRTAFFGKKLTSVVLPSTIETVGFAAFAGCYQLRSVTFPASLTSIEDYAFAGSALMSVDLPATIDYVGRGAFARCEDLESANINAAFIDDFTFLGDTRLSQVTIGSNTGNISKAMFSGCTSLSNISISPDCYLARIDDEAFINSGLESIDIKSLRVGGLGDWALAQTNLTSVSLAQGMTDVGVGALAHNRQLTQVSIPTVGNTPVTPGSRPGNLRQAGLKIRATLDSISAYMFAGDSLLNAGNLLTSGIRTIGDFAFYNVSQDIDTMRLPSNLEYLGTRAMAGMTGMKVLSTEAAVVPELGQEVWAGVNQPAVPLITPRSSTDLYRVADQWMDFFFEKDFLLGDVNDDGIVNIADITLLINYVLTGAADLNYDAADMNGDSFLNIADVTMLINYVLSGQLGISVREIHDRCVAQFDRTADELVVKPTTIRAGETRDILVSLENTERVYTAMQCEVVLPDGLTLTAVNGIDRASGHNFTASANQVEENVYSLIGVSMDMAVFAGDEGNVLRLTVTASDDYDNPDADVLLTNVVLATRRTAFLADDATGKLTVGSGIEQVNAEKEIAAVRYINVAGQESDVPFSGMNIVVTTYTDGTSSTVKVIK